MGVLLTLSQAKDYLEVEHTGDDTLIGELVDEAEARMMGYLEVPITATTYTEFHDGGTSILFLRRFPIDGTSVTVTDTQGTSEDATDDETFSATKYRVYADRGEIMRTSTTGQRKTWAHGRRRWKVEYDGGLDQHPLWSTVVQPELRGTIRALVAEWYDNRQPGAGSESDGEVRRSTPGSERDIPSRVQSVWDQYRATGIGG